MSGLPSRIGKYTVHERLGRGGMAEVYLAHDAKLDRLVALKLLREFDHEELLKRFEREARAIARLAHPNIVTIYELGDHDGRPFIAMEYVAGESLAELTRRRAILPLGYRLKLLEDLCAGLACAHRAGIVHRDVKPANLMVDNQSVLKVLDFGIVRMAGPGLTQMGTLVGTVNYMSPEQVSADALDHRSDIFSVGAVFYEILSYRQAFSGTFVEVISKIMHAEPVPISELCVDLDAELVTMVSRCLAKTPGARYQDLLTLRADIERARHRLEGEGRDAALDATYEATIIVPTPTPSRPRKLGPQPDNAEEAGREVDTWLQQAAEHLSAGQLAMASDLIGRATLRAPNLPQALALRRELERAAIDQERAEQRNRAVRASLQRAHAKLEDGAHESALRAIAEALVLDAQSSEALELRARVEAAITAGRRRAQALRAAEEAVRQARERFAKGDVSGALGDLEAYAPPHVVVTQALQELRAEVAQRERRHEEQALQRREEDHREREQRISAVLAATREAIRGQRFDEAVALIDQAPEDEAHASAVEALRRAASSGAERLRVARDAVARARALANQGQLVAALGVLDENGLDHPLVSHARRDIRRARTRQKRTERWEALRSRGVGSRRAVGYYVRERMIAPARRTAAVAGAYTRSGRGRAAAVVRNTQRQPGRQAGLQTRRLLQDRRSLVVVGALVLIAVAAIMVVRWPHAAQSVLPTAARSTTSRAPAETSSDTVEPPAASSTVPPDVAPVPDRPTTEREAARLEDEREASTKPPASKPRPRASESARDRQTKTASGVGEPRERDGNGSVSPPSDRERDTTAKTDDTPRKGTEKPSPSRDASSAGTERASRASKPGTMQTTERAAIRRVLNAYEEAYSSLSEAKIRALQPGFEGFPQTYGTLLRSVTLTILNPSIEIAPDGQSATVKCFLRYDYVWKRGGLPPTGSLNVTWRLKKAGESWVIVD
ncbi:MAG: protein kinase [Luteitalea sp.]|nr:protein kinase [Luteitalea sp.]